MTNKINITLYENIDITFYPDSHQYKIDGVKIPSVSSVIGTLNKPRMAWRIMSEIKKKLNDMVWDTITQDNIQDIYTAHLQKSQEALDIGTEVHNWCEQYAWGNTLPIPVNVKTANGVMAFLDRVNTHNVTFIENEKIVYSQNHNYIGTFDALAFVDNKKSIIDFKTSKRFYPVDQGMQLCAYKQAYEEEHKESIENVIVLHLDKITGNFSSYTINDYYDELIDMFNLLCTVKHKQTKLKEIEKQYKCKV